MLRTIVSFVFLSCILFQSCLTVAPKVTKEEAIAAAKRLESVVESRNMDGFSSFFDKDAFCKILESKSRAAKDKSTMKEFRSGFSMITLAKTTIEGVKGGRYSFLRHYEKDGRQRILFRIMLGGGGFNYQDFQLIKVKNTIKAEDVYSYYSGENMSTTVAEVLDVLVPENIDPKKSDKNRDSVLHIKKMNEQHNYVAVKESYERLPPEFQNNKGLLIIYIQACQNIDDTFYIAAMEKFAKLYPDAPNSFMMLLDAYILAGENEKALFAINRIDEIVGGDPFLNYYRALMYKNMGKIAESKACYEKTFAYDPTLAGNMEALILAYVEDKETDKAKKVIATYKTSKGFDQKELDYLEETYPALFN